MNGLEVQFDGLVGPTHHYGGLSPGNRASMAHEGTTSHPKQAALQGLDKMEAIVERGVPQTFVPPQPRPHLPTIRDGGFTGSPPELLSDCYKHQPERLSIACSSASMWAANAATVSPAPDTDDRRLHVTPANLASQEHRLIETSVTERWFQALFKERSDVVIHEPLSTEDGYYDEGAANHMRMVPAHGDPGVEIFVHGRDDEHDDPTDRYPARQTRSTCEQIAEQHRLDPGRTLFLKQNPKAIDAGVFHNDVAAVSNERMLLAHERAYRNTKRLRQFLDEAAPFDTTTVLIPEERIPLSTAVDTYLFNSQIVTQPDGTMHLVSAHECSEHPEVRTYIEGELLDHSNPISGVTYVDLRESMKNGGGPACLRLRIVMAEDVFDHLPDPIKVTPAKLDSLRDWVREYYRTTLTLSDLADGELFYEARGALADLWHRFELEQIISFDNYWEGSLPDDEIDY